MTPQQPTAEDAERLARQALGELRVISVEGYISPIGAHPMARVRWHRDFEPVMYCPTTKIWYIASEAEGSAWDLWLAAERGRITLAQHDEGGSDGR